MKPSFHTSFNYRCLSGALLLSALFLEGKAQAQVDVYVSETAKSNSATTLLEYAFNPTTGTVTLVDTSTPTGVFGGTTANESSLEFSESGTSLSYAGFTSAAATTSSEVLFTPSTDTFSASTNTTSSTVRSSYFGTSTTGTAGFFVASGSSAPRFIAQGASTAAAISTDASTFSANTITYNGGTKNLYVSRNSTSAGGVYTPSTNGLGLVTSGAGTLVALTGGTNSGWSTSDLYTGMAFLGTSNLFVANTTTDTLDLFTATNPDETNDWNLKTSISLLSFTGENIEQVSVDPLSSTSALIFFTTNGNATGVLSTTGISTLDEVSYNASTGSFGTPIQLESSSADYFTGVAAVPEPGTYAMFGLGLGLLVLIARKKAGRKTFLN